jgi:chemotaxis protein methyltransferase CheR
MMSTRADIPLVLNAAQFQQVRDLLATYCGVYVDDTRRKLLEQALAQRLERIGEPLERYLREVCGVGGRGELQQLAELALNHETFFFRNGPQFEALRREVLPALHRARPAGRPLRFWSAGCATGEEAFSLAICALETLGGAERPIQVWATDLSEAALRRARLAHYSGRALAQVGPAALARYFEPADQHGRSGSSYVVRDEVRRLVRFEQRNLLDPFPPNAQDVDIIFCQNVTIYFRLETCRQLVDRFYAALPEGGMLFLGFSETLWQIYDRFQLEQIGPAFVYVKRAAQLPAVAASRRAQPVCAASPHPARRTQPPNPVPADAPPAPQRVPSPATPTTPTTPTTIDAARALLAQGLTDEARRTLRELTPESPSYPQALALLAQIHADQGDLDTAVAEARRAIDVDPLTDEAYLLLGLIALRQGQQAQAITQLERARYLNGGAAHVRFYLAEAYRQAGRAADARREYTNALRALDGLGDEQLLDGVTVAWLRDVCRTYADASSER